MPASQLWPRQVPYEISQAGRKQGSLGNWCGAVSRGGGARTGGHKGVVGGPCIQEQEVGKNGGGRDDAGQGSRGRGGQGGVHRALGWAGRTVVGDGDATNVKKAPGGSVNRGTKV